MKFLIYSIGFVIAIVTTMETKSIVPIFVYIVLILLFRKWAKNVEAENELVEIQIGEEIFKVTAEESVFIKENVIKPGKEKEFLAHLKEDRENNNQSDFDDPFDNSSSEVSSAVGKTLFNASSWWNG